MRFTDEIEALREGSAGHDVPGGQVGAEALAHHPPPHPEPAARRDKGGPGRGGGGRGALDRLRDELQREGGVEPHRGPLRRVRRKHLLGDGGALDGSGAEGKENGREAFRTTGSV